MRSLTPAGCGACGPHAQGSLSPQFHHGCAFETTAPILHMVRPSKQTENPGIFSHAKVRPPSLMEGMGGLGQRPCSTRPKPRSHRALDLTSRSRSVRSALRQDDNNPVERGLEPRGFLSDMFRFFSSAWTITYIFIHAHTHPPTPTPTVHTEVVVDDHNQNERDAKNPPALAA